MIGWAFRGSGVIEIHIPDGVEKLCGWCFSDCKNLSRVTFGESSSLKLIGKKAFFGSGVVEIHVPDGIERVLMDSDISLSSQCRIRQLTPTLPERLCPHIRVRQHPARV